MKVLVTGGAGFIGSHLVDRLVDEGYDVRVLDNLTSGKLSNIDGLLKEERVEFIEGDIRGASVVDKALSGVDLVVHLAALISVPLSVANPELTFDVNLSGASNLLRSSVKEGVGKFVFVSSCAVYGEPKIQPITEETMPDPISPYAESKLLGERYCLGFHDRGLLRSVILRFFNVYGPRQCLNDYSGVITLFLDLAKRNRPLIVYGDGSQTRDFVSVHDIVEAILASLNSVNAEGEIVHIGSGRATSVNELAEEVLKLTGAESGILHKSPRTGDIKNSLADISKAKRLLGYAPKVSLRDGLRELL
jgi:nucleoside-diphosphate-sugar epimerase